MSTGYLKRLFQPKSLALVELDTACQNTIENVLANLQQQNFPGNVFLIGKRHRDKPNGEASIADLSVPVDLAVVAGQIADLESRIKDLAAKQIKVVMIVGDEERYGHQQIARNRVLAGLAKGLGIRIVGPSGFGVMVPGKQLNASLSHLQLNNGPVAFVGQSSSLASSILDWASDRDIGFSHFIALGYGEDVNLSATIDYLSNDPWTKHILVQFDSLHGENSQHLISSIKAASRNKLVVVMKTPQALTETASAAKIDEPDEDALLDTVLRRCGAVRIQTIDQLFDALQTLASAKRVIRERIAIVGNSITFNAIARERLLEQQGRLANFSDKTLTELQSLSRSKQITENPFHLGNTASAEEFSQAVAAIAKDASVDAILTVYTPSVYNNAEQTAQALIHTEKKIRANLLSCWVGRSTVLTARLQAVTSGISAFTTPEKAIDAYMLLVDYYRNQQEMKQTPKLLVEQLDYHHLSEAQKLIDAAVRESRDYLTHGAIGQLLELYGIPVAASIYANHPDEVPAAARSFSRDNIAIKLLHRGNAYPKSERRTPHAAFRDLIQDVKGPNNAHIAAVQLSYALSELEGDSSAIYGYCLQPMQRGYQSLQLELGIARSETFGPMIYVAEGGLQGEQLTTKEYALPPLNETLAKYLLKRAQLFNAVQASGEHNLLGLYRILIGLSQLVVELPQVKNLEISSLLLNQQGIQAIDFSLSLGEPVLPAIRPYPQSLVEAVQLHNPNKTIVLRPVQPEDEPKHLAFWQTLSADSIRSRYFYARGVPSHDDLAASMQIDYDREMAFIAVDIDGAGREKTLGVVRTHRDSDNIIAEFSMMVSDDYQGRGLGLLLLEKMVRYCREQGTLQIRGITLPSNKGMQAVARKLGFVSHYNAEEVVTEMVLDLNEPQFEWQRNRLKL